MSGGPRCSIVVPTRNRAHLLPAALRSALAQTDGDLEVIVSDNASTDDTAEVARAAGDPRVRLVRTPGPLPMHQSWRFAVAHARGDWITILCDDDALHPETLARAADAIAATGAEVVSWRSCSLLDAAYGGAADGPRLRFGPPYSDRVIPIDGAVLLDGVGRLEITETELAPKALNALWSRALLERLDAAGTSPFHPSCPDYSFMLVAAAHARALALLDAPLLVAGATPDSIGAAAAIDGEAARAYLRELRAAVPDLVPPPDLGPIVRWIAQTYLQCVRDVPALRGRSLAAAPGPEREDHLLPALPGPTVLGLGPFDGPALDPGDATIDEIAAALPALLAGRARRLGTLWSDLASRAGTRDVVLYGLGLNGRALLRTVPPSAAGMPGRLVGCDDAARRPPRGLARLVASETLRPDTHFVFATPASPGRIVGALERRGFVRGRDLLTLDDVADPVSAA